MGLSFLYSMRIIFIFFPVSIASIQSKCNLCISITKQFKEGILHTDKSNFGGGNTHWEDKNLGSYTFSETRFLEILENVCVPKSEKECHQMLEENEEFIESWWFNKYAKGIASDIRNFLCVEKLKVCCPDGTFGKNCDKCSGGDPLCSGHGSCMGDGTKEGTGECICDKGYEGEICDECSDSYFQDPSSKKLSCITCHKSCKDGCVGGGRLNCNNCNTGWNMIENKGCIDIDECIDESLCAKNEFCFNYDGSYKCIQCHKSCESCKNGTDKDCTKCADQYFYSDNRCKACHISCASSCTNATSSGCDACKIGWIDKNNTGCRDIDECKIGDFKCATNQYCINTIGSYKCSNCHHSCDGCTGEGKSNCKKCLQGYIPDEKGNCLPLPNPKSKKSTKKSDKKYDPLTDGSWLYEIIQYFVSIAIFIASSHVVKNNIVAHILIYIVFFVYLYFFARYIEKEYKRRSEM